VLFYGASYSDEFGYRAELEQYAAAKKDGFDFTFICTSSRPDAARGWTPAIAKGRVNEVVRHSFGFGVPEGRTVTLPEGVDGDALKAHVFAAGAGEVAFMACGNPGMIEDLKEPLAHAGVGSYLVEEFWKA
jgi:NAD(P)H-flavin reductase